MTSTEVRIKTAFYSAALRNELIARNAAFAKKYKLAHRESYGTPPVIVYEPEPCAMRHGNFLSSTYQAICLRPEWHRRLQKVHAQARTSLPRTDRKWCELDSCISSDALLMNVFCHPGTIANRNIRLMLGIEADEFPAFGVRAHAPLLNGRGDRTEVDMQIGDLLVEAKLTESDFQRKSKAVLASYRDFGEVFQSKLLPQFKDDFFGYQLIRNILAAYARSCSFCVLLDARRPDLLEQYYEVISAVRDADMRIRCKVLTWQELAANLEPDLQQFLDEKYGIVPPGLQASPLRQPSDLS